MKKEFLKTSLTLRILFLCIAFCSNLFAQTPLELNTPIKSEIVDGKPTYFTINLTANQTARIEAEQTDADVSLTSYKPAGEKILEWGMPLGRVGSEEILIIAESAGEYRIEVSPGNRHRNYGKFIIELTEVRETIEEDKIKNRAAREISEMMPEATRLARVDMTSTRRTALGMWEDILRLSKIKADKVAETRALNQIASLFWDLGELQKALDLYVQLVEDWRELKNRRLEMVAAGRIAHIWTEAGEYEKAIAAYIEGKKISREIGSKIEEADSISSIGISYLLLEQPGKARTNFEQALLMYSEMKNPRLEAYTLNFIGKTYFDVGDYGTAIGYFQKGLDLQKKGGEIESPINSLLDLGKAYKEIGDSEKAFDFFMQANTLANELGNRKLIAQTNYHLAISEGERGNLDAAIEKLEIGLKIIEKTRGELRNKSLRTSYFSTVQNFYELYIDLLIKRWEKNKNRADIERAFEMSERSRSRSLVDLLEESKIDFRNGVNHELLVKERDLLDEINSKHQNREQLRKNKAKQEQIDEIAAEINRLEIEFEKLSLQIRRENPRFANLVGSETLSTKEIQKLLDKDTVLLEYKLGKERSFLWLVTENSINFYKLPKRVEIETNARRFYDLTVANKNETADERRILAEKLGEILLGSVEPEIKGKRLAVVAEGILQYLPFSALKNPKSVSENEQFLIDTNEIVILPSASVLAQLRKNRTNKQADKTIAIFADPVFDKEDSRIGKKTENPPNNQNAAFSRTMRDFKFGETLPRLLASRQEAGNIFGFVDDKNATMQLGFDANLENIENADLSNYRILHFATHGLLNTSRPELSGLVFSLFDENGKSRDGFLSLNDIYNLELSSDMVVLSACQTALGKDVRGEGLIGISRGFLYAGSQRIVASLWKVDDSATAEFMKLFYKNHLEKKMSASAALRLAQIEMKKIPRYKSPYYWSAFTLLGEWK